ncbi:amino acid adenylation domain-containing protein [Spirosoma koreense]
MAHSCFIIGNGTLLIECTTILREKGYLVRGVISQDPQVRTYCDKAGLLYADASLQFVTLLEEAPFDLLFSISNGYVLPEEVLRLPRFHTINYHDGPLPAYAGVHATFWALLNGERTHGITWHLVDTGIDTGAIVKQSRFPIEDKETSISLNIKSYAAAVHSFQELINELTANTLTIQPQDLTNRSYYARNKRPDLLLDYAKSADYTDRLHRALDFGFQSNPFGLLKIWDGNNFWLIQDIAGIETKSRHPPGTIVSMLPESLLVATRNGLLSIRGLLTLDGKPISLTTLYQQSGLVEGQVLPLPAPDQIQAIHKADGQCARYKSYWLDKIGTFQPTTLPWLAKPGGAKGVQSTLERVNVVLSPSVQAATELNGTTVKISDLLVTAVLITLARLANQRSVSVLYQSEVNAQLAADTAGLFVEFLPFRVEFDWEAGLEEALGVVQQEQTAVQKHLTFAGDSLANQAARHQGFDQPEAPLVICRVPTPSSQTFPRQAITILLAEEAVVPYQVVFDPASWSAKGVADFVDRCLLLLENLICQSNQPLKTVSLLTPQEQHRMLNDWNATEVPYPFQQAVHQLIEAQVQQRPQTEAIRFGDVALTYEQLNQAANQLAWYLQKLGVKSDTLVGICLERSPDMIVSLLAILKAGGAYVPLDPTFPAARLTKLAAQTNIEYIISRKACLDRLPKEKTYILLDEALTLIAQQSVQNLAIPIRGDQLAYVLFTSGSTGRPKSVAIPHRAIVRTVWGVNYMRLDETVCMLGLAPLAFDASTLEIWGSLTNGGRLVLVRENPPSLEDIKQTIQAHSVNAVFFTAALFNVLVDSGISSLTTLTQLATGGEAASTQHVGRARHQLPDCVLINGYGPTESTTFASFYNLSAGQWETASVPIGKPLTNTQLYIVDSFLNPMPVGVPGELLIGGDGLAREYLYQPELTQQKFIPDPFRNRPNSRLYRTGDQARYLPDGTIEFLGRLDDQLKIRGFRIEPGEIEQALCQHPSVAEAVVLGDELTSGMKRLVAYVVPRSGALIEPDVLRAFLKISLPDFLIPNLLIPIGAIPLTGNGKVDKSKLPLVSSNSSHHQRSLLTSTALAIKPLWKTVLNVHDPTGTDHFFDSGGSSLMAIQLISLITKKLGVRLNMNDVFKHPTLQKLSDYIDQLPHQDVSLNVVSPTRTNSASLPLSFAQNRLWILEQLYALQGTYNVPIVLRIQGALDLAVMQKSLTEIIRRHESLRTTFGDTNGSPFLRIESTFTLRIPVTNLSLPTDAEPPTVLANWLMDEAYQPFDLNKGPLVRVNVANLGEGSWILLLTFHHLIYDGLSTKVLANELSLLYSTLMRNLPASLPALPIQYADYAQWQADQVKSETLARELAYWKQHLASVNPLLNLPIDKPRPAIQSFAGADYSFALPYQLWQQIRYGFQEPGTTLFLRLLTVFVVWVHQTAKTSDVVIGIPVAGRNRPELDGLIGFFVNTVVLRVNVFADLTYRQLLATVRQLALEAYDHQEIPFERVVEAIRPPRTLGYSPLVQVLFDLQEDKTNDWKLAGLQVEQVPFEQRMAKFDLTLSCRETPTGLVGTFNYRVDLFNEQTLAKMADQFVQLIEQLVSLPDQPITYLAGTDNQLTRPLSLPDPSRAEPGIEENLDSLPKNSSLVDLLKPIWCRLLDKTDVGLDEDFFALGGHSLLAVQMMGAIQRQTTYSLPISSIFAHPTIRQLALYLEATQPDLAWQSLVSVKNAGDGKPLFLVHPISGDVNYVYQLAPYLSETQTVYGLRAVGLDGISQPLESIESLANYYVQLILDKQSEGPYSIGGFSLGGIIAFEMARQLRSLGKQLNLVALIDAYPINPHVEDHTKFPMRQLVLYYYHYWRSLPKDPVLLLPILRKKVPWISHYLFERFRHSLRRKKESVRSQSTQKGSIEPENLLAKGFREAYSRYEFKPYDGKVVFLRVAKADVFGTGESKVNFGWGRYARHGVDVHQLVGQHESLFSNTSTIAQIGRILQSYL